jgi:hypothetical protein
MFLDSARLTRRVERHARLFKKNQGTVRPPGPAYTQHHGVLQHAKDSDDDRLADGSRRSDGATSRHALLTGDQKFIDQWIDPIVKGCEFVKDACAKTGHGGVEGVMPPAVATDTVVPSQAVWNQAWVYKGLTTSVQLLKRINHPRRGGVRCARDGSFARNFRKAYPPPSSGSRNGPTQTESSIQSFRPTSRQRRSATCTTTRSCSTPARWFCRGPG